MKMVLKLSLSADEMRAVSDNWRASNFGDIGDLVVALLLNRRCVEAVKRLPVDAGTEKP